jgi:hypothetical protein
MEKNKTAVEWLAEKYNYLAWMRSRDEISASLAVEWLENFLEEAKKMEKQQIIGLLKWMNKVASEEPMRLETDADDIVEQYYNETYGSNKMHDAKSMMSKSQPSCLGAVSGSFSSTVEKQQSFYNELKALLVKYDAELTIEDFGNNWQSSEKIVVDFKYDESFFEKENTGIIPQLVLGRYENGL